VEILAARTAKADPAVVSAGLVAGDLADPAAEDSEDRVAEDSEDEAASKAIDGKVRDRAARVRNSGIAAPPVRSTVWPL
jgi:hypothetical protein